MKIEKPKSGFPFAVIFIILFALIFIVALSYLSRNGRAKTAFASKAIQKKQIVQPAIAKKDLSQKAENVPAVLSLPDEKKETLQTNPSTAPDPKPIISASQSLAKAESVDSQVNKPAALLSSFYGDVKVLGPDGEVKIKKNRQILKGETIEVGASGEAVIEIEELYILRLKPNSKLTQMESKTDHVFSGKERVTYRFKLEKGALLGTTKLRGEKINMLDLLIKDKTFNVQDSTFRVQLSEDAPWIGVLRGNVKSNVENISSQNPIVIHALEKVSLSDQPITNEAVKVSDEEYGLLRETYEMNMKTAAEEARDLDLSKRAGNFFENVFDHGTFYTENVGYTVRDFFEDKASGDVYLEAEYDVFPANSFVGLYVLTRNLDAQNYGGLRFDVRRKPDEGYPDRFYLEIKSKGQIVNRFEITDIKPEWEARKIDFFVPVSMPITEVTIVFLNENIGSSKKGYIQMRNVQMVPLTNDQKLQKDEAKKNPLLASASKSFLKAPRSLNQSVVTETLKAKKVSSESELPPVPYKTDSSRKIAQEVPKIVSFDDLSQ